MESGFSALAFGLLALGVIYAMPLDWRRAAGGLLVVAAVGTIALQLLGVL